MQSFIQRFRLSNCKSQDVPADPNSRLSKEMCPKDNTLDHLAVPYREAVGGLMYLMVLSRPDIAFAVSQVSRFNNKPGRAHWKAVKRIYAYLASTKRFGIHFDGGSSEGLKGYADADYAGNPDNTKSRSGYLFTFNSSPVSWSSKLQSVTAQSTTESELIAACEASKEAVWLRRLVSEIFPSTTRPTTLYCDNQSTIEIIKNPVQHQRCKHIEVKYFYIREQVEKKEIDITYVKSEDQLADTFTKPLSKSRFEDFRNRHWVIEHKEVIII